MRSPPRGPAQPRATALHRGAQARRPHIDDKPGPGKALRARHVAADATMTIEIGVKKGAVAILAPG